MGGKERDKRTGKRLARRTISEQVRGQRDTLCPSLTRAKPLMHEFCGQRISEEGHQCVRLGQAIRTTGSGARDVCCRGSGDETTHVPLTPRVMQGTLFVLSIIFISAVVPVLLCCHFRPPLLLFPSSLQIPCCSILLSFSGARFSFTRSPADVQVPSDSSYQTSARRHVTDIPLDK